MKNNFETRCIPEMQEQGEGKYELTHSRYDWKFVVNYKVIGEDDMGWTTSELWETLPSEQLFAELIFQPGRCTEIQFAEGSVVHYDHDMGEMKDFFNALKVLHRLTAMMTLTAWVEGVKRDGVAFDMPFAYETDFNGWSPDGYDGSWGYSDEEWNELLGGEPFTIIKIDEEKETA